MAQPKIMPPQMSDYAATVDLHGPRRPAFSPVVSIVTVVFNGAATIGRTIESVQQQTLGGIEHIVVDGGSTDATCDIIATRLRPTDFWISERDKGISDAFNKGVALSRGRFILFLNADDWATPEQVERSCRTLERSMADYVYGDLVFHESAGASYLYKGTANPGPVFASRMPALNHPTALVRRSCFEKIGLFSLRYRNSMDYDWFYRLHRASGVGAYDPAVFAHMTHDGVSNRQFRATIREVKQIAVAYGRNPFLAELEAALRSAKTTIAQPIKRNARPLYLAVRRRLNPSFRPLEGLARQDS